MRKVALLMAAAAIALIVAPPSQAGAPCLDLRLPTASPVGTSSCPGVRPGALVLIPSEGVSCTLGFLYRDGAGRQYMTTAGHCAVDEGVQKVWAAGKGPIAEDSTGKPFGRFVFAALKPNYDIGIIAVNKGVKVNAAMCHFGGPTGVTSSRAKTLHTIEHYGNASLGLGDLLPARTGIVLTLQDAWETPALLLSYKGDSGGPVLAGGTGKALGYVTTLGAGINTNEGALLAGPVFITRLGPQMALASKALKRTFTIRTAPHSAPTLALP